MMMMTIPVLKEPKLSCEDTELLEEISDVVDGVLLSEEFYPVYKEEFRYADELAREYESNVPMIMFIDYKYKIFNVGRFPNDFKFLKYEVKNELNIV